MQELDGWIGQLLDEIDRLGIAENTMVVAMGDNGTMKQALVDSGYGGKADVRELALRGCSTPDEDCSV